MPTLGRSSRAVASMTFDNLTADADALRYPERLTHLLLLDTCADKW